MSLMCAAARTRSPLWLSLRTFNKLIRRCTNVLTASSSSSRKICTAAYFSLFAKQCSMIFIEVITAIKIQSKVRSCSYVSMCHFVPHGIRARHSLFSSPDEMHAGAFLQPHNEKQPRLTGRFSYVHTLAQEPFWFLIL